MGRNESQRSSFNQFINQINGFVLALIALVTTLVGFITLVQDNARIAAIVLIALGISLLWLACLYFAYFWKPEEDDGKSGLILPPPSNKQVKRQTKKERLRRLVRRAAICGVILIPLLSISGYGTWIHVQGLPNDDMTILVAEFKGPDAGRNVVTETILKQLREATKSYDDVEVIALGQAVSEQDGSEKARKIAEQKKADIMIWGWYGQTADTVPISANFEVLETNEYTPDDLGDSASGTVQTFDIAELNSFRLQTQLSSEMSFLTLFTLGVADYANKNWKEAIKSFDNALQQIDDVSNSLDLAFIHFYQGNSYFSNENFREAIAAFDQALNTKHLHEVFYNKGNALFSLDDFEEAIEAYDQALSIKSDKHEALNNKGNALFNLGEFEEAIKAYDQALSVESDKHETFYNKGNALLGLDDFEEAIKAYDQALSIKPDKYEALSNKGNALGALGEVEEAIETYDKALSIKPDLYQALYNKGLTLANLGKLDNALKAYDKALSIKPDLHEALYDKALIHSLKKEVSNALQSLQEAIALKEDYRKLARTDPGFNNIRQNSEFQKLINPKT